jgi:DNA-binding NarL/FixJ family response regulator
MTPARSESDIRDLSNLPDGKRIRKLSSVELDQLVHAYLKGATVYELAKQFGVHRATVGKHLRSRGIDTTPRAISLKDEKSVVELYEKGWSTERIAFKFNTSARSVRARLLSNGVRMRDTHGRERTTYDIIMKDEKSN